MRPIDGFYPLPMSSLQENSQNQALCLTTTPRTARAAWKARRRLIGENQSPKQKKQSSLRKR